MRTLSLIRHRNVVRMAGYSIRDGNGFIVTEYMPGGTLFEILHRCEPRMALDWETRFRIAFENAYSTRLTEKLDVYSYGVVLLELLLRKMPVDPSFEEGVDIVSWTRKKLLENDDSILFLDEEINYWESDDQRKALKLLEMALDCTEQVADTRPSMRDVVGFLIRLNDKI
ncbi:hypothetical protein LWI29_031573 [Acer saccharum]|uniref:Protein kinase domain-containing protein n=1 Tax=Acer saccharum TaxID=4024 RepID=A0AA39SJY5_ACESA|nr:hypothetical protein LWI29_031573 [Acer saccharum]